MTLPDSPACNLLGSKLPLVLAGMGGVARSELVAAVTTAGGFGFLGMVREPPKLIEREVTRLRELGHSRFGVNIIPASTDPALLERQVATLIALAVPVVCTFWTLDQQVTRRLRDAGIMVVHQVGSVDEAIEAVRSGVEIVIAQGREAGGHVRGTRAIRDLLPEVADAVNIPVLAAGGMATGADLVTAMALGASGIVLGTALMATEESFAHAYHKQRLLAAEADDTVLTSSFHINWPPNAPTRVLKSAITSGARGDPHASERTVIGDEEGRQIYLFSTDSPLRSMTGDFESMALYAGTGIGHITAITSATDRLTQIVAEAETLLAPATASDEQVELASSVCYAGEMSGAYMGEADLTDDLWLLAAQMRAALRTALAHGADPSASSQPPFAAKSATLASWALQMRRLAARESQGAALPPHPVISGKLPAQALILQALGGLIPRISRPALRDQLVQLRLFLEAQGPAAPV
ncbi:nitronate monooxygenase family protein [Devosia ginsengisoli]|uniref:NAD(P)H-dependent flavin oxidoreductase n=1 Tax=Devosia ginsengisoli TaxID=400770 RepID=UPI0026F31A76|nr:nitronate monooxygenase [Devosia ginsengisoli]MCR6673302.1 nitronate monooxygenase [Devosia ginsengisoli]